MEPPNVTVALRPVPGFCVKSRATNDTVVHRTASHQPRDVCGPPIPVTSGTKIFVNIAWDPKIPPAPPASEDAIRRAVQALDIDDPSPDPWFVPVVLSDARQDSDKAGHPALVFDCVLNPSIKSRTLNDPEFKNFIIELAFQRIEAQSTLLLSRQIGTPNIASKGKPQARRVLVPVAVYPPGRPNHHAPSKLIQEISDRPTAEPISVPQIPAWSWTQQGSSIRIVIDVPAVTHAIIRDSTLDIEPRRVILHAPSLCDLDLNLDASDAELSVLFGKNNTADEALTLKRMRNFDVDNARAEWRVADRVIVLLA